MITSVSTEIPLMANSYPVKIGQRARPVNRLAYARAGKNGATNRWGGRAVTDIRDV